MMWAVVEVNNKGSNPPHSSMNTRIIPRSIFLAALNGFPKLDLDIIVRLVKLYKTSSEATLIPLVVESNKRGWKWKCGLVLRSKFGTNVALLTRIWTRTKCYCIWMKRKKWNKNKHIKNSIPSTCGLHCLSIEDCLSQSTSSKSSKNSFPRNTRFPLARASHRRGKAAQFHSWTRICQKI